MQLTPLLILLTALAAGPATRSAAADQPPRAVESAAASPAAVAIAKLLETEITPGNTRLEAIQRLYQEALAAAPRDPRLEYACSLVFLRSFEPTQAARHLKRALELDPGYIPANQAIIRDRLKARNFAEAGERLSHLVDRLEPRSPDAPQVAEWAGRIVSAVISAVGTPDAQSQFGYHDRIFRKSMPPVLLASYERGFTSVQRELEVLQEAIEQSRSAAAGRQELTKAQVDADLKKDQNEIKLKQQDAQKSQQKWEEWITDQTAKADDLLREHEKRFQDLDRAITTQQQSVIALRLGIDRLERGITAASQQLQQPQQRQQQQRPATAQPFVAFSAANSASVELQLAVEEQRLAGLFDQQAAVARQAAQTLASRRAAVAQYQQATGVALKEVANLDRWEKRNQTIAENMKKAAERKPPQVAALENRIRNLSTWDPADFESEKRRLLAELGIKPKDKTAPETAPAN